jgi:hypothetical protein
MKRKYFISKAHSTMDKNKLQTAIYQSCHQFHHHLTEDIEGFMEQLGAIHRNCIAQHPRCKTEIFSYNKHEDTYIIRLSETFSMVAHLVKGEI